MKELYDRNGDVVGVGTRLVPGQYPNAQSGDQVVAIDRSTVRIRERCGREFNILRNQFSASQNQKERERHLRGSVGGVSLYVTGDKDRPLGYVLKCDKHGQERHFGEGAVHFAQLAHSKSHLWCKGCREAKQHESED